MASLVYEDEDTDVAVTCLYSVVVQGTEFFRGACVRVWFGGA